MADVKLLAVIDPGHGPSCVNGGSAGYREYKGMWSLSNCLMDALKRCGWDVMLTRNESEDPSLSSRGRSAAQVDADVFISEHSNAANKAARGVETYYSVCRPGDKALAAEMSKRVSALMSTLDRGAKTRESTTVKGKDYYSVLYAAETGGVPHVLLVENGFHDNTEDEAFLLKDENLKAIAETQAEVLCNYFGVLYIGETASVGSAQTNTSTSGKGLVPDWQMTALAQLKLRGVVKTPEYWLQRMGNPITVGEAMALIAAATE